MWTILWLLCGLIGAGLMLRQEWETNDGLSLSDLLVSVVIIASGPVILVVGLGIGVYTWVEENASKQIIKRKKYDI